MLAGSSDWLAVAHNGDAWRIFCNSLKNEAYIDTHKNKFIIIYLKVFWYMIIAGVLSAF
jgi:hypothetical protein